MHIGTLFEGLHIIDRAFQFAMQSCVPLAVPTLNLVIKYEKSLKFNCYIKLKLCYRIVLLGQKQS